MKFGILCLIIFIVGLLIFHYNSTLGFLFLIFSRPAAGSAESAEGVKALVPGFFTPIGAVLLVLSGFFYRRKARRWSEWDSLNLSLFGWKSVHTPKDTNGLPLHGQCSATCSCLSQHGSPVGSAARRPGSFSTNQDMHYRFGAVLASVLAMFFSVPGFVSQRKMLKGIESEYE